MRLYTYYRSQASFRVRIALNLKGLRREDVFLHLERGDQFADEYRAVNPQMVVPTLLDGDTRLFQSLAILEYFDEQYPEPPLLPIDARSARLGARAGADQRRQLAPADRAARAPLPDRRFCSSAEEQMKWLDPTLARSRPRGDGGAARRASGERPVLPRRRPTLADICLVTQVTPAKTFSAELDSYPRVMRVYETCMAIPAFADAHPSTQPDSE